VPLASPSAHCPAAAAPLPQAPRRRSADLPGRVLVGGKGLLACSSNTCMGAFLPPAGDVLFNLSHAIAIVLIFM
jgi:hypothetical protein